MGAAWSCWECLERFDPCRSIAIGSGCIWDKFVFLATRRPGDCMEMLLECLRNPGYRLGIVTDRHGFTELVDGRSGGRRWFVGEEGRGEPWEVVAMEDRCHEETQSIWKNTNRRAKCEQLRDSG
eukprot:Gb_06780 [translate_table: standard]